MRAVSIAAAIALSLICLLAGGAGAQSPPDANARKATKKIEFIEATNIRAQRHGPGAIYMLQRSKLPPPKQAMSKSFLPRIVESTHEAPL